ncbi:MAG: glycoside hydrolase family 2 protein [Lachnospiraceae bacterium]|nr:glycoside hydrolase family 2 protein [Lachnospiraceae bacterium]
MIKQDLGNNEWSMRMAGTAECVKAKVPGSVYGDYLAAGKMEDPFWKDNEDAACALMENDFEYQTTFTVDDDILKENRIALHFYGLDTIADVFLNGEKLGHTENMHREWEYEVKDKLKDKNELKVYFYSPNKYIARRHLEDERFRAGDAMPGFNKIRKAHCMFGWDWGAHLPDAGIWRPVYLFGYSEARVDSVLVLQEHEKDAVNLKIKPEIKTYGVSEDELVQDIIIITPDGKTIECRDLPVKEKEIRIDNPILWWPNGYGSQDLYKISYVIRHGEKELDAWTKRIGLRTITVSREPLDIGGEEFATTVNGLKIFSMGADYIPEDHLLGRVTPETTKKLLASAKWANHNSIRVWGGGYYPDDWFYDICDELGLLVWQDFMFACNLYDLDEEFEENIKIEFDENIKRLRHHASLAIFSGNNEIEEMTKYAGAFFKPTLTRDYIIMFERIIKNKVKELAPQTFYWPSSPSSGGSFDKPTDNERGDQHYWEVWHGNKPFSEYRKYLFRYCSEFGFQSFPAEKTVDTFTDNPKDKNIFSYIMERHQRNGFANGKIMNYMQQTYLYPSDFNTLIYASQLLQADGIRYGVEHFRRNRGVCMGSIVWQLNDCWPVASWASIDYAGRYKALHYYEKRFFAPIMISCEEEGMMNSGKFLNNYPKDFNKSIRLAVANETGRSEKLTVHWAVRNADASVVKGESIEIETKPYSTTWLDKVDLSDIKVFDQYISYDVCRGDEVLSQGTVNLSFPKYFHYEDPKLTLSVEGRKITVTADKYAKSVEILNENEDIILSDNYFDMNAGSRTVEVESGDIKGLKVRSVYDIH